MVLPTPSIRVYDENGDYTGTRLFENTDPSITFPELTESEYDTFTQTEETEQQNTETSRQEVDSNQQFSDTHIAPLTTSSDYIYVSRRRPSDKHELTFYT